jgi:hypothetical protein
MWCSSSALGVGSGGWAAPVLCWSFWGAAGVEGLDAFFRLVAEVPVACFVVEGLGGVVVATLVFVGRLVEDGPSRSSTSKRRWSGMGHDLRSP